MAELVRINNIPLEVADETARIEAPEVIGELVRAYGGQLRTTRRAVKRVATLEAALMPAADARAWRALLLGEGHVWAFNDHPYSSKGRGPSEATSLMYSDTDNYYPGTLALDHGTTRGVKYPIDSEAWSVIARHHYSLEWHHVVIRSDGACWQDGSLSPGLDLTDVGLAVSDGEVLLGSYTSPSKDSLTNELVILPFAIPDAWVDYLVESVEPWGGLPALSVTGDLFGEPVSMVGELESVQLVQARIGGTWHQDAQRLAVRLMEV